MAQAKPTRCWAARWPECRGTSFRWSGRSVMTSTPASAKVPRASPASPIRACADRPSTPTTCAWQPSAASNAAGSMPSMFFSSTIRTERAIRARRSGTRWKVVRAEGLTRSLGVAPGPANGFTLDVIDCLERFGDRIDWAMVILNPLEPWPGELVLPAAERHDVRVITRVVDYGGLFHDDVLEGHAFPRYDHRGFRPDGWVERGPREARGDARDRRPPRADAAAARLPLEPRPRPGAGRRADADRGAGRARSRSRTSSRSWRR